TAVLAHLEYAAGVFGNVLETAAAAAHRASLGEIKIALRVGLQIEGELVERRRRMHVAVENLVKIRLAVVVEIVQANDTLAAERINLVVHDLQAERLKQAGGIALPGELVEFVVDAGDDPNVAAPGAERGPAIREEIEAAEAHPTLVRVVLRDRERIHDIGAVAAAERAFGVDRLGPARRAALRQRCQIERVIGLAGEIVEARELRLLDDGEVETESGRSLQSRQFEQDARAVGLQLGSGGSVRQSGQGQGLLVAKSKEHIGFDGLFFVRLHLADQHGERLARSRQIEGAAEYGRVSLVRYAGSFENLAIADRVAEDDAPAVQVVALEARPIARQSAVGFSAWIRKISGAGSRPARRHRRAPELFALDQGPGAVAAVEWRALQLKESLGPAGGIAQ